MTPEQRKALERAGELVDEQVLRSGKAWNEDLAAEVRRAAADPEDREEMRRILDEMHNLATDPAQERAGRKPRKISVEDWDKLAEAGIIGKVELWGGYPTFGPFQLIWSSAQVKAARAIGIELPLGEEEGLIDPWEELHHEARGQQ